MKVERHAQNALFLDDVVSREEHQISSAHNMFTPFTM